MRRLFAHVKRWGKTPSGSGEDFDALRAHMVDTQLVSRKISDSRVLKAMRTVPRHLFVPEDLRDRAYDDRPLEIGFGQTISQPYMVAFMTQLLRICSTDRVLEIGTGSGYQTAVLASLARHVVSIERIGEIGLTAAARLRSLGYDNTEVHVADGTLGWRESAPYDAIIVTAAGPSIPRALKAQVAEGGRLVCPVGPREMQRLILLTLEACQYREEESIGCVFVPLIGDEGWTA